MQPILSLGDFFARSGAHTRFYTLGRQVTPCTAATLADFEAGEIAWPRPWLGRAQLACVFQLGDTDGDPLIWFLSLPLDEQGHLDPAPRDAFLRRLLETLGRSTHEAGDTAGSAGIDNLMKDNPLAFTPDMTQRAVLHARANADLERGASEHLEFAEGYLTGQLSDSTTSGQWQALGLQGLADFAIRHDTKQAGRLATQLPALPVEVVRALCHCLEHVEPAPALCQALTERGEQAVLRGDSETLCACVRAVGQGARDIVGPWYDTLLVDAPAHGPDLLAAIAARGWAQLEDAERLPRFLDALANDERTDFAIVVRDLALIPRLRLPLLMSLRQAAPDGAVGRCLADLAKPN
ncbi:Protein of unknown function [Modicisalibacter muralis]|uniref:DUF3549 domain-containing protein n=1 Tax=Modicisalibacter muralis TaxID=119000 RepID=A0A1G9PSI6_9GAMM|nr:DUF3549 family protein [Halomonas muralis]SDM01689.1 Protein of unknown function [Halomonas muralis]